MAIFGLNFNGTEIPARIAAPFAKRIPIATHTPSIEGKNWADLAMRRRHPLAIHTGVATTPEDCARMVAQADNGNRAIFVVKQAIGLLGVEGFGIYIW